MTTTQAEGTLLGRRHRAAGWWSLVVFVSLGLALEMLHGFKVNWYLDLSNETRRHLLTLAHAHGTLLALVNLAFATLPAGVVAACPRRLRLASAGLLAAQVLLPGGFLVGGLWPIGGDPGLGIAGVPLGAAVLLLAVTLTALSLRAGDADKP